MSMKPQFTSPGSTNALYLACQVMKRALLHYKALYQNGLANHGQVADDAVRKAEYIAGVVFDVSAPWLDEWIGLETPDGIRQVQGMSETGDSHIDGGSK